MRGPINLRIASIDAFHSPNINPKFATNALRKGKGGGQILLAAGLIDAASHAGQPAGVGADAIGVEAALLGEVCCT